MKFEWNPEKRAQTLNQRGLDFADLSRFEWDDSVVFDDNRRDYGEHRQSALGMLDGRLIAIAFTMRGQSCRIISMRKANNRERKVYDSFGS